MPNTNETTSYKALTDLSRFVWEQKRYFETVRGYSTLETERTKAELLEEIAKKVDDIIVTYFSLPASPEACLRRAEARLKSRKSYYMLIV